MTQQMLGALSQEPGTDLFSAMVFNGTPENVDLPDNLDEPFESVNKSLMDLTAYESDAKFKLERIFERLNYLNRVGFINRSIAAECMDLLPPEWQKRGINHYSITGTKHNYKFAMEGLSAGGWALVAAGIGALVLIILKIMDIFGYGFGGGGGGGGGGGSGSKRNNNIRSFEEHAEIVEANTRTNTELEEKILKVLSANNGKITFPDTSSIYKYNEIFAAYKKLNSHVKDVPLNQETFKKVMYAISSVRTESDSVIHIQKETNGATDKDEFYNPGFLFIKNISINRALLDSNAEINNCIEAIIEGLTKIENPTFENIGRFKNEISTKTDNIKKNSIDALNGIFNDSKLNNANESNLILSYIQFDELFTMFESDKYAELFKTEFSSNDEFDETMKKIKTIGDDLDKIKKKIETTQNTDPETMKSTLSLVNELKEFMFVFHNFYQRVYKLRTNFAAYPGKFTSLLESTAKFLNEVAKENKNENIFDLAELKTIIDDHSAKIKP